jgi:L-aspartate oxidase
MWRAAGVRREGAELEEASENIDLWCSYVLPRQFSDPQGWELQNMLTVARVVISAALQREETRGVHLRIDFPQVDNVHWKRRITFRANSDATLS